MTDNEKFEAWSKHHYANCKRLGGGYISVEYAMGCRNGFLAALAIGREEGRKERTQTIYHRAADLSEEVKDDPRVDLHIKYKWYPECFEKGEMMKATCKCGAAIEGDDSAWGTGYRLAEFHKQHEKCIAQTDLDATILAEREKFAAAILAEREKFAAAILAEREKFAAAILRVMQWDASKPAATSFTAGDERQIAYIVENHRQLERERCAAVCRKMYDKRSKITGHNVDSHTEGYLDALDEAEQKIKEGK